MYLKDKTILLTGGCGSFGQKFTEVVLKDHNPKSIRIYDNRELALVEMERNFNDPRLRFFLGDVRDKERLNRATKGVDVVVNAAAIKHVPICEYNPIDAIRTNVDGATNVVNAAIDNSVERAITISTDKAVYPVNLYGATKMVAEKVFIQGNVYSGGKNPIFACSRYGNVIGSSGSVIPLFLEQKVNGSVTVTDERMTRFWITLEDGIRFVINCIEDMKGGEIFVPKISSMKITDLADVVAPEAKKNIIGIRPGEKLHEVLLTEEESTHTVGFDKYFVVKPEYSFQQEDPISGGDAVPEGFTYTSGNNDRWITKEELKEILKQEKK